MAAAPPSPRPPKAHRDGGDAPVSLFLDTDLGTHFALLVAPDTAIRGLKSQVAAEHAAAFPDLGPVAVKSFQVRRKGVLYHLSDSMTLTSAFTKIRGGCFLHVKMAEAATTTHCCQDTLAISGRRLRDGQLGIHVKKHVQELPVTSSDIAHDMLSQSIGGCNNDGTLNNVQAHDSSPNCILVPSLPQLNTELENKAVGLASDTEAGFHQVIDKEKSYSGQIKHANQTEGAYSSPTLMAYVDKSSKESSYAVDELHARKEGIVRGCRDHDVGAGVSATKQVKVEEHLVEEMHAVDNLSREKEHEKTRTGSFDTSCGAVIETDTTIGEPLNTSNHQEVHDTSTLHVESIQLENPSIVGKKKRKKLQLAPSTSASAQGTTEPSAGVADLSKPAGEVLPHSSLGLELNNTYAMDDQEKEHIKSRTDSFDASSRALLETDTTSLREPLTTSNHQQVHEALHEESIQLENPSTARNKTKRKRRQLAHSKSASAQETAEPSAGAADLSKSTGDGACNVELTGRDETVVKASYPLLSSELTDGNQEGKYVDSMCETQASAAPISEQEKFGYALKGCRNLSIADAIYSTGEIPAIEGKTAEGICAPSDGGDKYEEIKQHNEGSYDDGVPETSNMMKDGKSTDALDKRQINQNTSQGKKRKKSKKVSSVDMPSVDTTGGKEMHGYKENAAKSDTVSTEREIVHEPSMQQMSHDVYQEGSNVIENQNGDAKKKNKRRRHTESSKGVDPSQDLTKSSGFVTNESSIQCADAAPIDVKQTTPATIEGATVIQQKQPGETMDTAVTDVIDEVLADLRSNDSLSKDLDGDLLAVQNHLVSNQNMLDLPESKADKLGVTAALPPKYPAVVHSDAPVSSPRHKKSKGKKSKVLSTMTETNSSHHSSGVPEDANRELNESDSLRFTEKTSDSKYTFTGDVVGQADDKPKATKRRKKGSAKQVVGTLDLKELNATEANLVQSGSAIDTPLSTVGKVEQKDRSSETLTHKIQETSYSTHDLDSHLAKNSQGEYATDIIGTHHHNENAAETSTLLGVQKDAMALKSASSNAQKERNKSLNSELQIQDSALGHGSSADLESYRTEKVLVSPKNSVNADVMVRPSSDGINFLDHFSCSKMNDVPPVSAENNQNNADGTLREMKNKKKNKRKQGTGSIEQNDVLEPLLPIDETNLTGHFGTSKAIEPPIAAENMNRENENVKNSKEKKKKKLKANMEVPAAEKENPNCYNEGTDIGAQTQLFSAGPKGRMGQDNGKEGNSKVIQNDSIMQHEPEDATWNHTPDKNPHQSVVDGRNKLLTGNVQVSKEVRKSTSQAKAHSKTSKPDASVKGRAAPNPKPVRNLVKDFSMSPRASSDSTESTPQIAKRFRVAVRKVPKQRYDQISEKSKNETKKLGSSAIFNDDIGEGSEDELEAKNEKAVMEASPANSSTSADSAISSAPYDESEVPDDDGAVSLSQKSLKGGLHIGSILRGSSSYKKVRQKQMELSDDDDTIVPDSQPTGGFLG